MDRQISRILHTSAAALMGTRVVGADGRVLGRVRELVVDPDTDSGHIAGVIYGEKIGSRTKLPVLSIATIDLQPDGSLKAKAASDDVDISSYLLLDRDVLDQQIIDMNGRKVVRVNDVDLRWEAFESDEPSRLRIAEVEVGLRGALRRLLKGMPRGVVHAIAERISPRVIPWDFVDLIERDPGRRVRLKVTQNRLAHMHPSDIADILEELAPAEREAVFASLNEEIAAEALEEVDPKLQKALIEGLASERVAEIVEEMDPGAAADLLAELSEERSEAILEEMDPEERQEVEELLEFSEHSAAGWMTTDYVSVGVDATIADAILAVRDFEGDIDMITDVLLMDSDDKLKGILAVTRLLLAKHEEKVLSLTESRAVFTHTEANAKQVAELFDKYNLRSLPVVNDEDKVVGVIYAEHVISLLREGR